MAVYDDNMEAVAFCYADWDHSSCVKNLSDTVGIYANSSNN